MQMCEAFSQSTRSLNSKFHIEALLLSGQKKEDGLNYPFIIVTPVDNLWLK